MIGCPGEEVVKDFLPGLTIGGIITFLTFGTVARCGTATLRTVDPGEEVLGPRKICLWTTVVVAAGAATTLR